MTLTSTRTNANPRSRTLPLCTKARPTWHTVGSCATLAVCLLLAACGSTPRTSGSTNTHDSSETVPQAEPLNPHANRPYTVLGKNYAPLASGTPYKATGTASWYGKQFHGKKTSSGERFDMNALSAAHTVLPIPSYARVTNLANGKSVVVRVNDRGPFHAGRIIDLSYAAAQRLDMTGSGMAQVQVESLVAGAPLPPAVVPKPSNNSPASTTASNSPPPNFTPYSGDKGYFVQLGSFSNADNAETLRLHMARELEWLSTKLRIESAGNNQRVQVGPFINRAEAEAVAKRIGEEMDVTKPIVVSR